MFKLATLATACLQELHRPTCPSSVTSLHLLECTLCTQLTPRHVCLVACTKMMFAVLPLSVLVCGTVCRCSVENLTFCSTVLNRIEDVFVLDDGHCCALQIIVKSTLYKSAYFPTYLLSQISLHSSLALPRQQQLFTYTHSPICQLQSVCYCICVGFY